MHNIVKATLLAAAVSLGACTTTSFSDTVAQIRKNAVALCGFQPIAADIGNIVASSVVWVGLAEQVAAAICQRALAVASAPAPNGAPSLSAAVAQKPKGMITIDVGGVIVRGKFVTK